MSRLATSGTERFFGLLPFGIGIQSAPPLSVTPGEAAVIHCRSEPGPTRRAGLIQRAKPGRGIACQDGLFSDPFRK